MLVYAKRYHEIDVVTPDGVIKATFTQDYSIGIDEDECGWDYNIPESMSAIPEIDEVVSNFLNNLAVEKYNAVREVVLSEKEWTKIKEGEYDD